MLRGQQESKCFSPNFVSAFSFKVCYWAEKSHKDSGERERVQRGVEHQRTCPISRPRTYIPPTKSLQRGFLAHSQFNCFANHLSSMCPVLGPGQTLKTQRWRQYKVVSLGAWGIPENETGAGDPEMFWYPQGEWSGFLKLPASWCAIRLHTNLTCPISNTSGHSSFSALLWFCSSP